MKNPLPKILERLTGVERYVPEIEWSNLWTHNIFRCYEKIFGRRFGIRPEVTSGIANDKVFYIAHTFEGLIAILETAVRRLFSFKLVRVYRPQFAVVMGMPGYARTLPYVFAIAHDVDATSITTGFNGTITKTWTHVATGSNLLMVGCYDIWQDVAGTGTVTATSFNAVAFTANIAAGHSVSMAAEMWYLKAAPSGSHTMSVTVTGGTDAIKLSSTSFSGANQTAPLDKSNSNFTGTTGSPSITLASVAANAAVVATLSRFSTTAATTNQTSIYNDHVTSTLGAASYQIATTTGSYTDTYTGTAAQDWSMIIASFLPFVATSLPSANLMVGQAVKRAATY